MTQSLSALTVVVQDYDEAIAFYVGTLGFDLLEDTRLDATKRWVRAV
jgi:catechol 2,3-dioxygenase-like lactoylglutathione lyase family enzyme